MSLDLKDLFGAEKPVVGMAHLPPLPGTPLYDEVGGAAATSSRWFVGTSFHS
jgi:predicted TIM-barrel enzyme